MGSNPEGPRGELRRRSAVLIRAEKALDQIETAAKNLRRTWNTAEGRRGRISEKRKELSDDAAQLENEREALRQEQWRLRKESATLQHAREQVDALTERIRLLEEERDFSQKTIRDILNKVKHLNGELRR